MSLWRKPNKKWMLGVPIGGILAFVIGVGAVMSFHVGMQYTNSNAFCYRCHIGMDTIVEEYQQSSHFNNAKGVVAATCSDCHVPREFLAKLGLKIRATADIYHKLMGDITLENFEEEHRPRLAEVVTAEYVGNKSKQCRYCHSIERMDFEKQSRTVARRHEMMESRNQSCIDCHAGIAHKLPTQD
ncbi:MULTISPECIES: NapC/NirT family cytochrome c [Vibrio]|jgi:nitrate/TMAO reductase-like tetraheme cytochrome c subunit|uniref:NapC/NirT family cytochrome c n=1 Tax=Vibrio TaxID=662 RepID=UPI000BFFED7C|nr:MULTISPECIES: NapC/NirT family cytochrome c [unclassified Vibrio]PHJ42521.1 cytochrome C [Vibrio sp. PID17_43]RIZ56644.1 cytochrome C [Vibrio sp. PID23_8]